tara:strand:+ start:2936 stop:4057 length:1122 start_codon:yes stop_codon:yes gene_type:complete
MFSKAIRIFTINGFDIKLDPSWLVIAALITWSLARFFPTVLPDQFFVTYVAMAFIAMMTFFASLLLHELAHSVVARHFGVQIKGITLFLFGGVAELESEPQSASVEFWVAIAGPLMSLFLALWFGVLAGVADALFSAPALTEVLSYLSTINLVLALFNLVPAFPLDGGRILRAVIWHRTGNILKATESASKSGTIVGYALMGIGLAALFQGAVVAGLWQILIGSFVLVAARASYQDQLGRSAHGNEPVSAAMMSPPVTVSPDLALSDFVDRIMFGQGLSFVPVVENGVLLGHMDRELLSGIERDNWAATRVGDIFAGLDPKMMITPEMPIADLMSRITRTGHRKFLVTRDGHELVGVVTLADLTGYLMTPDTP